MNCWATESARSNGVLDFSIEFHHSEAEGILEVVRSDPLMVEVGNGGSGKRSS